MLNLAIAVATGGSALGSIEVERHDVLYLALEDNFRRVKDRVSQMGGWPKNVDVRIEWPSKDKGGLDLLRDYLREHPNTKFVIIDTFKKIKTRGPKANSANAYDADYEEVDALKRVADEFGICLLVVHHMRKMEADDPLDTISGSTGLSAAVDTCLIFTKERNDRVLYVRGRDVEEKELVLQLDGDTLTWKLCGTKKEVVRSKAQLDIFELLQEKGEMRLGEIAAALGKKSPNVHNLLTKLMDADLVTRIERDPHVFYAVKKDESG